MPTGECHGNILPGDGGEGPPCTEAAVAPLVSLVPRRMRIVLSAALAACLWLSPAMALAGGAAPPNGQNDQSVAFGLTATQLVVAAAVGASAGTVAVVASGNAVVASVSLGFGTLGAIYVAHLVAEALVVSGIYYWWPWESEDATPAARAMAIKGAAKDRDVISAPFRLAPRG